MPEERRLGGGPLCFVVCLFIASVIVDAQEPASGRDSFKSGDVERLRQQVLAGNTNTERFWQDMASKGTPLAQSRLRRTPKHQVVTFLWRGSSDTKNVLVELYPFTWERAGDYVMRRVDHTDVWYLTVRLPRGARFVYRLSPNDPLDNPSSGVLRRTRFQADPLNPESVVVRRDVSYRPLPFACRTAPAPSHNHGSFNMQKFRLERSRLFRSRAISSKTSELSPSIRRRATWRMVLRIRWCCCLTAPR